MDIIKKKKKKKKTRKTVFLSVFDLEKLNFFFYTGQAIRHVDASNLENDITEEMQPRARTQKHVHKAIPVFFLSKSLKDRENWSYNKQNKNEIDTSCSKLHFVLIH